MSSRPTSVAPSPARTVLQSVPAKVAAVLAGSGLLALAAHISVPFWPVPITLQTLVVLLTGAVLGPQLAAATVIAYVAEGLAGLPVFSYGGGVPAFVGPTGGYIVGFLPAAILTGVAARRGWLRSVAGTVLAFAAAHIFIFGFGLAWLGLFVGWSKVLAVGLVPFLPGEALKIALATTLTRFLSITDAPGK